MKIITMYLPQFHKVKENDEWWGEGYTDWISARNAEKLFDGHYQPHEPLNDNYYDLLEEKTFEWQASLMKKYGVDGQCVYHYWFKDGCQILEKPMENLLKRKDIDFPFFFSWANQSWARSWSGIKDANVWCDDRETYKGSQNGLLLEQQYGDKEEWIKHFEYLLPFFKDNRYIKIDNKPVFMFYQASKISVLEEMNKLWTELAINSGFNGMYYIGVGTAKKRGLDYILNAAPQMVMNELMTKNTNSGVKVIDYDEVWKRIISSAYLYSDEMVGGFCGYDDTPRRGGKGCVIDNNNPEAFKSYLTELFAIESNHNFPFAFINAWNEWGEGMHLEPDKKYENQYLEAVQWAKAHYNDKKAEVANIENSFYRYQREIKDRMERKISKYESYWKVMDKLLDNLENNCTLEKKIKELGINKICIYGLGMMARHLIHALKKCGVYIEYGIDQKKDDYSIFAFPIYKLEDDYEIGENAIIVTPDYDFELIKEALSDKGFKKIISLREFVE